MPQSFIRRGGDPGSTDMAFAAVQKLPRPVSRSWARLPPSIEPEISRTHRKTGENNRECSACGMGFLGDSRAGGGCTMAQSTGFGRPPKMPGVPNRPRWRRIRLTETWPHRPTSTPDCALTIDHLGGQRRYGPTLKDARKP